MRTFVLLLLQYFVDDKNLGKCSKQESAHNGPSNESLTNGTISPVNGDVNEDVDTAKSTKRIVKECKSAVSDQPSTSPKKKKLDLKDLDDSTVVKNFITNDEIAEDDEDDSEDETFQLSRDKLVFSLWARYVEN